MLRTFIICRGLSKQNWKQKSLNDKPINVIQKYPTNNDHMRSWKMIFCHFFCDLKKKQKIFIVIKGVEKRFFFWLFVNEVLRCAMVRDLKNTNENETHWNVIIKYSIHKYQFNFEVLEQQYIFFSDWLPHENEKKKSREMKRIFKWKH